MKLKKSISVFLVCIVALLFLSSWGAEVSSSLDRKLNKFVYKTYDDKSISKHLVQIPDSLQIFNENNFYKLYKGDSLIGFMGFNRANSCRVGGCVAFDSTAKGGNFDPFYFATIYNTDFTIKKMKILEYYSDYGYEISSKKWLRQFIGKTGCEKNFKKQIDGISGATISVQSLIQEVKGNCELKNLKELN